MTRRIEQELKLHRRMIVVLSLGLILICLGVGYSLYDIDFVAAKSKIQLNAYNDNVSFVTINPEDIELMNMQYDTYENEFAICFEVINLVGNPYFKSTTTKQVAHTENYVKTICPTYAAMQIHSHPSGDCTFSKTDLATFGNSTYQYFGVVCGIDKYHIINREQQVVNIKLRG